MTNPNEKAKADSKETVSKAAVSGSFVLLDGDHSGRDEMNLAGNPFALLQASSKTGQTRIHHEWERTLPGGRIVKATWTVDGDSELGLPGPNEELLFLVLLQLTREQAEKSVENPSTAPAGISQGQRSPQMGRWPREVFFSRHNLIERLRWPQTGQSYAMLGDALVRLQGVRIVAQHSFYNPRTGAVYPMRGFALLDEFTLIDEKRGAKGAAHLPLSSFKWSDVLHDSLESGNVRSLALDFTLSLHLPTSVRLFRLLEMFRHSKPIYQQQFEIGLEKLRVRLGMTAYKYPSKIKEKLKPACDELIARGYLRAVTFRMGKEDHVCTFEFGAVNYLGQKTVAEASVVEAPLVETLKPGPQGVIQSAKAPRRKATQQKSKQETPVSPTRSISPAPINASNESSAELPMREIVARGAEIWAVLNETQRAEIRAIAREGVVPDFWDRLENPESPISEKLFRLVMKHHASTN